MAIEPVLGRHRRVLSFDVGLRHLAYADITVQADQRLFMNRWGVIDVHEHMQDNAAVSLRGVKAKKNSSSAETTVAAVVAALDAEFFNANHDAYYDHVLVENQPAHKNPVMKSVQVAIHTFFAMMRMYVGMVGGVHPVCAIQKLRLGASTAAASAVGSSGDKYRERKAQSVRSCIEHIARFENAAELRHQLDAVKKKDDMCDALLQAVWFIENRLP